MKDSLKFNVRTYVVHMYMCRYTVDSEQSLLQLFTCINLSLCGCNYSCVITDTTETKRNR